MLVECSESRVRSREDDGSSASGEELDRGCDASTWLENPHAIEALTVPHFEPSSGTFVIQFACYIMYNTAETRLRII